MMYFYDAGRVVLFAGFFLATLVFFAMAWRTRKSHPDDPIVQQHFMEHAIAAGLAFIGSLLGTLYSIVHLFSLKQGSLPEGPFTVAFGFLLLSGLAFMAHMIKEQKPGHPFYVRETTKTKEEDESQL